jgi:hypothetical protein
MTNCAKVTPERSASFAVNSKVSGLSLGRPEDERAEHVHAVVTERAQAIDQMLAAVVEVLVDVLQPFGVTASTPTSAPLMCAFFIAVRSRDPRRLPS